MTAERKPLFSYWTPRHWPVWVGVGLLRLACLLPHRLALALGRAIGRLAHGLGGSRRAVVRRNIELCFPELTPAERDALTYEHFKALGMMLIEMGLGRRRGARSGCHSAKRPLHYPRNQRPRLGTQ